jgi:hypothetical protein
MYINYHNFNFVKQSKPSKDTIVALCKLHPLPLNIVLPSIFNYKHEHTYVLDRTLFAQALAIVPHLSSNGLSKMVYEHLLGCFILKDPSSRFSKLFQVVVIVGISLGRRP